MYVVLPFLYLAGKVYGLRGVLTIWCLAVVVGIIQPHVSGRLDIAQYGPCFIAGVASYFLGCSVKQRQLLFIGWPMVIIVAGGILMLGNYAGYDRAAQWIMCLLVGMTAPFFTELEMPYLRKVVAVVAQYSYGVYLTHLHAQWIAFVVLKEYAIGVQYLALIILSVGLPIALYHLVESPMVTVGARLSERLSARKGVNVSRVVT